MTTVHTRQLATIHTRHLKIQHVQKVNNPRLAVPRMTPEPSVTVHILGLCFCTFRTPRDMLRHILGFVLRAHLPSPWPLLQAWWVLCHLYRVLCVGCLALTYHCVCRVFSPYVAAFIMSRLVCTFSGYHRDVNEMCALRGPTGLSEMAIRHYHTTLRRNYRRAQIWLVISHQSCRGVFETLIRVYQ